MSVPEDILAADRVARETALARLKGHAKVFKQSLQERPVKQRVADDIAGKARDIVSEATEIAKDSKPVIAGTIGLLALWFLRKPLAKTSQRIWPQLMKRFSKDNAE